MPLMETYAPGTFCWADLGTPDPVAATRFYTALFAWTADPRPMGPDAYYTMFQLEGRPVAALYKQEAVQQGQPQWLSYISVSSASDAAAQTKGLGGTLLMEPFDVLDVGRMALVQDPTGAVVALWEPRRHTGAGVVGDAGSMCWNELATTDPTRAGAFYGALLGWNAERRRMGTLDYTTFRSSGEPRGGMLAIAPAWGPMPPHWLVYFAVRDCDGSATLAQSLGGAVRMPPSDIPDAGRCAVLTDPQGAMFAVIARRAAAGNGRS
jgi:uncharacterized protein